MGDLWQRRFSRRRVLNRGAMFSLGAFLAACSPFGRDQATSPTTPARDELRISLTSLGTETLDPLLGPSNNLVFLDLLYDAVIGNNYKADGFSEDTGLAKSWKVSPDNKTFTFQLRPWKFHNGDDVTAEDVQFTLQRFGGPKDVTPQGKTLAGNIDSITVKGPLELELKLKSSSPAFIQGTYNEMTDVTSLVVPKKYFNSVGQEAFAQAPVGSGPYRILEKQTGASIKFEQAYPTHYGVGTPRYKHVTMRLVPDENTRISQLQTGDADFIDVAITRVSELQGRGYKVFPRKLADVLHMIFQPQKPDEATSDINVRRALAYAINKEEINKTLVGGLGKVSGEWMSGQFSLTPPPVIPFDVQQAKAFLNKTPYGDGGKKLTMQLQVPNRDGWPQLLAIGQAVQSYWKQIGVDTNIVSGDYGTMRAKFASHTLPSPAAMMYNQPATVAWYPNTNLYMSCNGVLSVACDPQLTSLLDTWSKAPDQTGYAAGATATNKYIVDNFYAIPILQAPLYYVGGSEIRQDYTPGISFLGINTRALITGKLP